MNDDLGKAGGPRPTEVDWVDDGAEGKLDLVTTLDFRMSSTCMYSDIVLPTATWYEKDDLNTSDMHPFIHPLSAATDPAWEAKSDWEIYKAIAKKFSAVAEGHLGVEQDLVTVPLLHDTPPSWRSRSAATAMTGRRASASRCRDATCRRCTWSSATTRTSTASSPRSVRCWTSWATAARASAGTPRRK